MDRKARKRGRERERDFLLSSRPLPPSLTHSRRLSRRQLPLRPTDPEAALVAHK